MEPDDRESGPRHREPVRPCDAISGRGDGFEPPAELTAANRPRMGTHVALPVAVCGRGADEVPRRPHAAAGWDGLRAGPRAVHAVGAHTQPEIGKPRASGAFR